MLTFVSKQPTYVGLVPGLAYEFTNFCLFFFFFTPPIYFAVVFWKAMADPAAIDGTFRVRLPPSSLPGDEETKEVVASTAPVAMSAAELCALTGLITYTPVLLFESAKVARKVSAWRTECDALCDGSAVPDDPWQEEVLANWVAYGEAVEAASLAPVVLAWVDDGVGWGLFAGADLDPGAFVGEYTGRVESRSVFRSKNPYRCAYPSGPHDHVFINAREVGNLMRFVNHGAGPAANVVWKEVYTPSDGRFHIVMVVAGSAADETGGIPMGSQILVDYGPSYWKGRSEKLVNLGGSSAEAVASNGSDASPSGHEADSLS